MPQQTRKHWVMIRVVMKIKQGDMLEKHGEGCVPLERELREDFSKDVTCQLRPE